MKATARQRLSRFLGQAIHLVKEPLSQIHQILIVFFPLWADFDLFRSKFFRVPGRCGHPSQDRGRSRRRSSFSFRSIFLHSHLNFSRRAPWSTTSETGFRGGQTKDPRFREWANVPNEPKYATKILIIF